MSLRVRSRIRNVGTKATFGSTLMDNEVSRVIYENFPPDALADGRYVAALTPRILGTGLEHIQTGMDAQRKGVSAQKAGGFCTPPLTACLSASSRRLMSLA